MEAIIAAIVGFVSPWIIQWFKNVGWLKDNWEAQLIVYTIAVMVSLIAFALSGQSWGDAATVLPIVIGTAEITYRQLVSKLWPTPINPDDTADF